MSEHLRRAFEAVRTAELDDDLTDDQVLVYEAIFHAGACFVIGGLLKAMHSRDPQQVRTFLAELGDEAHAYAAAMQRDGGPK